MNYVLDTNVISEFIAKQPNQEVIAWLDSLDPNSIYLTVITIGEIRKGIEKLPPSKRRDSIKEWLETDFLLRFQGRILNITIGVMLAWGELVGRLENAGQPISAIDSLVAAIAFEGDLTLVTRNDSDVQHTGIKIINPWKHVN